MKMFSINTPKRLNKLNSFWLVIALTASVLTACSTQPETTQIPTAATITASVTPEAEGGTAVPESLDKPAGGSLLSTPEVVSTITSRTPVPTPTPGIIDREIDDLVNSLGLSGKTFLGLTVEDWLNLAVAALIVVAGYFLGFRLLVWFLKWIAHRASRNFDESVLQDITPDLKLLLLVFFTRFAVLGLDFLSDGLRTTLYDLFFILEIVLFSIIAIKLINFSLNRYVLSRHTDSDPEKLDRIIKPVQRLGDIFVLIIASSIVVSHFRIGTNAFALALVISGVIIYLGARGIITDIIAGFIIMADQPFRINDAVQIKELDTWGIITGIDTRTTRIRTRDNREVIVPNSQINQRLVINYTYPDPSHRMQVDIGIAFGSDLDKARQIIKDALKKLDGVMAEKGVEVLFIGFGDTNRQIRVRWWIAAYHQQWVVLDQVCTVIESSLAEASIDMPFITYDLNVRMESEETNMDGEASEHLPDEES